ncbi:hypothetical protein ILYODFUR_034468, partial [Ilyodon furcidens]
LAAVFDEDQRGGTESPRESISNGFSSDGASPEAMHYCPHLEYEDSSRGEIEVNEAILKTSMLHQFLSQNIQRTKSNLNQHSYVFYESEKVYHVKNVFVWVHELIHFSCTSCKKREFIACKAIVCENRCSVDAAFSAIILTQLFSSS